MSKIKNIQTHGRTFVGVVISSKMQKTATVEWTSTRKVPKYERYEKTRSKVHAHNPEGIAAQKGDRVLIQECRPLSKTKNFMIIKKLGKDVSFLAKEEDMQASKFKKTKKEELNLKKGAKDESS